jgi:hypothetical protein
MTNFQSEFPQGERMPEGDLEVLSQTGANSSPSSQITSAIAEGALKAAKIPVNIEINAGSEAPQTTPTTPPEEDSGLYHSDGEHFPNSSDPAVTNRPPSQKDQADAARFIRSQK